MSVNSNDSIISSVQSMSTSLFNTAQCSVYFCYWHGRHGVLCTSVTGMDGTVFCVLLLLAWTAQCSVCFCYWHGRHSVLCASVTGMDGIFKLFDFFDKHKILSTSKLFSLPCFYVTLLSAVVVDCEFVSPGQMSFIVADCFHTHIFFSWLIYRFA